MATHGMVPPFKTYLEYFASEETNPFTDNFAAFMAPYDIDPDNAAAAHEHATLYWQVYSSTMLGDPTAFLLCHLTLGLTLATTPAASAWSTRSAGMTPGLAAPPPPGTTSHLGREATS